MPLNPFLEILNSQRRFFQSGQTLELNTRRKLLLKLKNIIISREQDILDALQKDFSKSNFESYATEFSVVIHEIEVLLKNLIKWTAPQKVGMPWYLWPSTGQILTRPYGTVLIIGPWNYPFQLLFLPFVGALAAGNTCILKPSEMTQNTEEIIQEIIGELHVPELVSTICGGINETQSLLELPFDYIFFTGSTTVGKIVYQAAAKNLVPVTLELGGKSPCIVDNDADLISSAHRIAWGKFVNAGQTCIAPDYLLVHSDIKKDFINELKKCITKFYGKDPESSPDFARIVNQNNFERLTGLLKDQKIVFGGQHNSKNRFLAPTLVEINSWDNPLLRDEIFGPILPFMTYSNLDDLLEILVSKTKPLALYYFGESRARQERVLKKLASGGACVNDCLVQLSSSKLPFGGIGASGIGRYRGKYSIDTFSHAQSIVRTPSWAFTNIRFPKYTLKKFAWVRRILRFKWFG